MQKKDILEKIEEIKNLLNKWSGEYYDNDSPTIEDSLYDEKLQELFELEKENPEFITNDSPTQSVGSLKSSSFKKVDHKIKMLSLKNAFGKDDLLHFDKQIKDFENNFSYFVEPKIDGISISLKYNNGILIQGLTRGDGVVGEDITENVKQLFNIPLIIKHQGPLEVRGEIYLPITNFKKINEEKLENGEKIFANPRNAAAGTMRQLDLNVVKERALKLFCYFALNYETGNQEWSSQKETIEKLNLLGFPITKISSEAKDIKKVIERINIISESKDKLDYEIDGVVIKVNEYDLYNKIGSTSKFPKWAIAYKFPAEVKETELLNIFQSIGRTGRVTYNAKLKPVLISGTTVQKATLHNAEYIINLDLRLGDIVRIKKAGEIIPKVISANISKRKDGLKRWEEDKKCLTCNSELIRHEGEVDQYCPNINCEAQLIESIIHFASRDAMNIEGFSEKQIENFVKLNYIEDIGDIYLLKNLKQDILNLEGYQLKSVESLLDSIEKTKNNSLDKLIFGLGIRHIGKKTAKDIAKNFNSIDKLISTSFDVLLEQSDLGVVKSESIISFFKDKKNIDLLKKIKELGIATHQEIIEVDENNQFYNKRIVITGTISGGTREEITKFFENKGAKVTSSISNITDYVIAGENASKNKLNKVNKDKIISVININDIV